MTSLTAIAYLCHKWLRICSTDIFCGKVFVLNRPSLSITRCRSRYAVDLSVSVVSFISSSMTMGYSVTNDYGYVPLVVNISRSFSHSWLITGCVTRLKRRVPLEPHAVEYQLRPIYIYNSISRCCCNFATYKWKFHNGKIETISFVVKFSFSITRCKSRYAADQSNQIIT
jgi:hypothetical protein